MTEADHGPGSFCVSYVQLEPCSDMKEEMTLSGPANPVKGCHTCQLVCRLICDKLCAVCGGAAGRAPGQAA